jgi:hypothetical protein
MLLIAHSFQLFQLAVDADQECEDAEPPNRYRDLIECHSRPPLHIPSHSTSTRTSAVSSSIVTRRLPQNSVDDCPVLIVRVVEVMQLMWVVGRQITF